VSPSATLVDKVSGALATRFSRRGFFARSAVVGSAIAANPLTYALTPTDAYAAVCSCSGSNCDCGSICCDGYTEFCCTLTGANQCPPGSLLGGWWKVDGSGFCSGPRYYMDCNAPCNGCGCGGGGICSGGCSGTNCGCGLGDCNNRKAGCVNFRYGQCNQQTSCIGPIVCRVVTCIAPWEIDATCTTTARYDANTAFHDRPCLHGQTGGLDTVEAAGGGVRVAGWAIDWDTNSPVDVDIYVDGQVVSTVRANGYRPDVASGFPGMGPNHGFDAVVPVTGGAHDVCAWIKNAGPASNTFLSGLLGCRPVSSHSPFGTLDVLDVGRGSITVGGWAIDPDTNAPIQVQVQVGGNSATVLADQPRPDVDAAFHQGPNHGFRTTIAAPAGIQRVLVYALNQGTGGNTLIADRTIEIGSPFGALDRADPAPAGVRVQGWAIDPDVDGPIQVHVYVGGVGTPILANSVRPDIGVAFPAFGATHGFDAVVPGPPGRQQLAVYAINDSGPNKLVAARSVDVLSGSPLGSVDVVQAGPGTIRVAGWVLDPDTSGPIQAHVYLDGVGTPVVADIPRPDVGAAFPGYGAVHGFDVTLPAVAGWRQVCVYGIDVGPGDNKLLGCRMVLVGGDPFGAVDVASVTGGILTVSGWAIDPDTAAPIGVHVYIDGAGRAITANASRPDLAAAFPAYGPSHGFSASFGVGPGTHQVCIYAIDEGLGENRLLACRTVTA
jgi:hypothetical protein